MSDLPKVERCPGCRSRYEGACPVCRMTKAVTPQSPGSMTYEQIETACANIGYNLSCGACAALFFTGYGGYEHDAGCPKAEVDPFEPSAVVEEPRFVWRRSVGDFATDVIGELGPMVAEDIGDELVRRTGVEIILRDREAAIIYAYGKPSAEMGNEWKRYVKTGTTYAWMPRFLARLARAFAEVRAAKEAP